MRVCIVAEGCYPFVVGGVSSWVHSLIQLFPETEFVILAIAANRSQRGKYAYELPKNVSAVYELYLDDVDWSGSKKLHRKRLKKEQYQALRSLILDQDIEWDVLFDLFQKENVSLNALLMGEDFLNAVRDCYNLKYSQIVFSNFLWTMRSIYLPLFLTMQTEIPRADLYHCVATGYAGVLGAMAKHFYGSRLLISEHGIYTREREEELIKAKWVEGIYKNIWIDQFRKMSKLAYNEGTLITSLFEHARELQIELGCPIEKTMVTPNGIRVENLQNIPGKTEEDEGKINIGAVLRVTPIKDVKTMIQAFGFAKEKDDRLKLWIMGPWEEDREYAEECFQLVSDMEIPDVVFTGRINIRDYLGRMDVTILTSISEGQPLTILESYAAHKPVITPFVRDIWLSPSYELGWGITVFCIVVLLVRIMGLPLSLVMGVTGLFEKEKNVGASSALLNLIVSLALVKPYGMAGVLLGTLLSYLLQILYRYIIYFRDFLEMPGEALRYAQDIGEYLAVIAGEVLLMQKIVPLIYGAGGMLLLCVCFLLCIAIPLLLDLVIFGRGWRLQSIVTMVKGMRKA